MSPFFEETYQATVDRSTIAEIAFALFQLDISMANEVEFAEAVRRLLKERNEILDRKAEEIRGRIKNAGGFL